MAQDGETQAWERLLLLDGDRVAARASAVYLENNNTYQIRSYGQNVLVDIGGRRITCETKEGHFLLERLSSYSILGFLHYLTEAKDILPAGTMVSPKELPGGDIFQRGTHRLPLHLLAEKFGSEPERLVQTGLSLGGERADCGDAGCTLFPFPRVPVTAAVWSKSEEFPAEAVLLFDSTCPFHLATDVIWATAMMSVGMLSGEVPK